MQQSSDWNYGEENEVCAVCSEQRKFLFERKKGKEKKKEYRRVPMTNAALTTALMWWWGLG
jgi:hypothetical protein